MHGKVCIVTGANSGIGKETAKALAELDATVILVVRNQERGLQTLEEIQSQVENAKLHVMICDLSSMTSVRDFVQVFQAQFNRLDVLINNAGAFIGKHPLTAEGLDESFAVNYLGPSYLTLQLLPILKRSAPARIISVSSGLQGMGKVNFDDLQSRKWYLAFRSYSNAKVMLILFTYALARRLQNTRVTTNVLDPGFVATNLGKNWNRFAGLGFRLLRPFQKSASKGAETSIYLATSPEIHELSGVFFKNKRPAKSSDITYEVDLQERLWEETLNLLGLEESVITDNK